MKTGSTTFNKSKMKNTQIEGIKQECLTIALRTKHMANNFETLVSELHQITQRVDDITLKISNLQNSNPVDFEDPELIQEWVSIYGSDYDDDFEESITAELDVNQYVSECNISITKEVESYNRDTILESAIERYLEWAKNQKETQAEEGETNG